MARLRLTSIHDTPLLLWGIVSPHPPHRLCWLINQAMEWNLERCDDIIHYSSSVKKDILWETNLEPGFFPRFKYTDTGWLYTVEILVNKDETELLFSELKNFDFLMVVHGETAYFPKNVKELLQKQEGIHSVLTLSPQRMKEFPRLQVYIG